MYSGVRSQFIAIIVQLNLVVINLSLVLDSKSGKKTNVSCVCSLLVQWCIHHGPKKDKAQTLNAKAIALSADKIDSVRTFNCGVAF